jgi:apolipoprotein N-acyltransferase
MPRELLTHIPNRLHFYSQSVWFSLERSKHLGGFPRMLSGTSKRLTGIACLVVFVSYAVSCSLIYILTQDLRQFLLVALECAFLLLVLPLRRLFLAVPREIKLRVSLRLSKDRAPRSA